jgi:hypothetical protein
MITDKNRQEKGVQRDAIGQRVLSICAFFGNVGEPITDNLSETSRFAPVFFETLL